MARPVDSALRQRLIDAAGREFATHGFAGASMAGIGAVAAVTKGGVYFHFRSKERLFFAVVDRWRDAHRRLVASNPAADSAGDEPPPTLREFLVRYLRFHFHNPEASGLMRVLASEMRGRFTTQVREDHQATLRAVRARIRELLMRGIVDGILFTSDPALATFVLAAGLEGVLSLVHSSPRDVEPFRHPESIVEFLLASYELGASGDADAEAPTEPEGVDFLPPI